MTIYPTADELLETSDEGVLFLHRSFRSSVGLMALIAASVYGVVYCIVEFGSEFRWLALIPVGLVLVLAHRFVNDLYIITRDKIVHQQGRVSLRYSVPTIRCIDLRSISVDQTLWGRILNYGNLSLATAAQSGPELVMSHVVAPSELAKLIDDLRVMSQRVSSEPQDTAGDEESSVSND
jgi:hypothetical protein